MFSRSLLSLGLTAVALMCGKPAHAQSYFECVTNTGNNATVIIPASIEPTAGGAPLQPGDEIAAFTPGGLCAGVVRWTGAHVALTVWGDNVVTEEVDGFREGDPFDFRVWQKSPATVYTNVTVTFDGGGQTYVPDGISLLTSLAAHLDLPDAPTLISPPDGSDKVDNPVTLAWEHADSTASYSVQLATDASFSQVALDQADVSRPYIELADLQPGTAYHWRVRANVDGTESEWSEAWSFQTASAPLTLAAPVLADPADEAVDVELPVRFSWEPAEGATAYELQVARKSDFSPQSLEVDAEVSETEFLFEDAKHRTTYFWRVRGQSDGLKGDWSDVWTFETAHRPRRSPNALAPKNGASNQPLSPTLEWSAEDDADAFQLHLAESASFNSLITDTTLAGTSVRIEGLSERRTYFWRVRSQLDDEYSDWSDASEFTTMGGSPPVALLHPSDGAVAVETTDTLRWSMAPGATYRLQVSNDATFEHTALDRSGLQDTVYVFEGIGHFTVYYWRVRTSEEGTESDWSETRRFTSVMAAPVLDSPGQDGTVDPSGVTLTWSTVRGAEQYEMWLRRGPADAPEYFLSSTLSDSAFAVANLEPGASYTWSVRAVRSDQQGPWAPEGTFSTASGTGTGTDGVPGEPSFALYPNPARGQARLEMQLPDASKVQYRLFDTLGRLVLESGSRDVPPGRHAETVDLSPYPPGTLWLHIEAGGTAATLPVTIVR